MAGDVRIFSHPGQKIRGPAPHARFEGEYFSVRSARIGDKVNGGNIIRTGINGKARLVYQNGDQINIGAGTAYRVVKGSRPTLKLMYGKLRGVISRKGPRKRLRIRTNSATMGVRGTDFFIADRGKRGGTEVSVLRGKVQVKPEVQKKPITVKQGFSAEVASKEGQKKVTTEGRNAAAVSKNKKLPKLENKVVELRRTNKADLAVVHRASTIKKDEEVVEAVNDKAKEDVKKLEKEAVKMTLNDIKETDKKLYAKISAKPVAKASDLNTAVVKEVFKKAPAPDPTKPFKGDLEDLEDDAYRKYFKVD